MKDENTPLAASQWAAHGATVTAKPQAGDSSHPTFRNGNHYGISSCLLSRPIFARTM